VGYVRATFLVALVDAVGVGTGLAIMAIPLALPLASLVFLGAFIPLVGAVLSGFLAVVVALLAKGWVYALITLGVLIGVNQLEAHILQPLVMGRAVSIHPLAVVVAISTGGVLAGIVGALLAVPTVAFFNNAFQVLLAKDPSAAAKEAEDPEAPILQAEPDVPQPESKSDD
jgi:predicted PurR-regulated permease PerM